MVAGPEDAGVCDRRARRRWRLAILARSPTLPISATRSVISRKGICRLVITHACGEGSVLSNVGVGLSAFPTLPPPLPLLLDGPLLAVLECLAPCADFIPARMLRRTHTPPKCDCDSDAAMIPLVRGEAKLSGVLLNGCARKPEVRGTRLSGFSSGFSFRVYTGVMQGVHRGGMKVAGRKYEAPACQGLVQGLGRVKIGARMKVAGSKYETLALTKSSEPGTPTPNSCHSCSENAVLRCSSCASFKFSISRP